ncbi:MULTISPECIES: hypothetical protein [unclassified Pyrobaculum]|uniref:hypothetical protein n=1 Tax=unclassified Pyrobaculum TaxID=2643434 RepID=UPI0021DB71E5|nr:hypothetical protein [Pyrobaculum sp. 3827-6]MCU7787957.1 hypothetical protein [Pyrobaculum sp. 3827-6]
MRHTSSSSPFSKTIHAPFYSWAGRCAENRFAKLLEVAKVAVQYGASLHVYGDSFVVEDRVGPKATATL